MRRTACAGIAGAGIAWGLFLVAAALAAEPAQPAAPEDAPDAATLIRQLTEGTPEERLAALGHVAAPLKQDPDKFLPAVIECAKESEPPIRTSAIVMMGQQLIWVPEAQNQQAIDFALEMSREKNEDVVHACIYFCLSTVRDKNEALIDRLVELACAPPLGRRDELQRIVSGFQAQKELAGPRIQAFLDRQDPAAAPAPARAVELFYQLTGEMPERVERFTAQPEYVVIVGVGFPFLPKTRDDVVRILRNEIGNATESCEIYAAIERRDVFAFLLVKGLAAYSRVLQVVDSTDGLKKAQVMVLTPELRQILLERHAQLKDNPVEVVSYETDFLGLYEQLGREYPNFAIKGIDWAKVGADLLPASREPMSADAFAMLCHRLVARLEDSHAFVGKGTVPPVAIPMPRWDAGFSCLIDDRDRPVIFFVQPGSPAAKAGLSPGMAILSVNGTAAADALEAYSDTIREYVGYSSAQLLRHDAARGFTKQRRRGATLALEIETVDGMRRTVELPASLELRYVPRLPVPSEGINDSADLSFKRLDDGLGYLYVRRISQKLIESLDHAVGELKTCPALIVDVRGNSGGGFDAERALRNFDPHDKNEPERPRFAGPIAVLIDARCISAGEGWSSWFRANKRARFFGETTAGASARKKTIGVAGGLFQVTYSVKAYTGFLDRPIERLGIEPDVMVRPNAGDLSRGIDTVLQSARRTLLESSAPSTPQQP